MRAPKIVSQCDGCHEKKRARYRTLVDRYLCEACYRRPTGVPASAPHAVGAGQTGQTLTVDTLSAPDPEAEFDLSHLTGGR